MSQDKWVTFDCFGTLYDWQTGFRNVLEPIARGKTSDLIAALHDAELVIVHESPSSPYKDVLRLAMERAAEKLSVPLRSVDRDILVRSWGSLPIFPDTAPALAELKADGWRIGILTNSDSDLFSQTEANFPVRLDMVVTADQVNSKKPALPHFQTFEARSGVDRSRWVHAAVSWVHDMVPASQLGIRRVWIDRENSGHDPAIVTARIPDMASLPAALRSLENGN